jgi:hypothetical protein
LDCALRHLFADKWRYHFFAIASFNMSASKSASVGNPPFINDTSK